MMKTNKPTLLDYAILGLLRNEGMTGYRIRKTFEETAMGNYSSSPGTIYPALKRLQRLGLIEKVTDEVSGKTLMRITDAGKNVLIGWLTKPIELLEVEKRLDELLLRFAFMDVVENQSEVILFLERLKDLLTQHISDLLQFHQAESGSLPLHGRLAFEQGIDSAKATLKWCKRVIKEIS
jgi:DNA-binding PadR family transcriptional regulator